MKYHKWSKQLFCLTVILLLGIGFLNYIVDPYGLFRFYQVRGFNQQKEGVRTSIRYVKALEISLRKPKTIIMGSSRVHDSINPNYSALQSYQPVYNYGIDMVRIKEIKYYLEHALKNTQIENLFIGLDFFMFNKYERLNYTFDKTLVNKKISLLDLYFKPLFTISALESSWETLKVSRQQPDREEFLSNGYRPAKNVFFGLRSYEKLHLSTNWIFLSSLKSQTLYYAKMAYDDEAFNDLKDIFNICKKNNINLKLYISPAHANLDGEGILAAGLYRDFENWKRRLVSMTKEYNLLLYDFSGYNRITTEQVKTPMQNYWDSSHFTEKIGNMILDTIVNDLNTSQSFGVLINPENIELHLKNNRENMAKYHKNNVSSLIELHEMYKKALSGQRQDSEQLKGMFY